MSEYSKNDKLLFEAGQPVDPSQYVGVKIPEQKWLVESFIPHKTVTLLSGDGGLGKSLLSQQLATSAATGMDWLGCKVRPCKAFALFCEDSNEELLRRQNRICESQFMTLEQCYNFNWMSGDGIDPVLMAFAKGEKGEVTQFFDELMGYFKWFKPELVIIDTAADTFAGDEIKRIHVRNFINRCLKVISHELDATVILTSHPSKQGMVDGSGISGSTAWNNSVRSRLYLTRPKKGLNDNLRVLENKKANYGPTGDSITLEWRDGVFRNIEGKATIDPQDRKMIDEATYLNALQKLLSRGERALTSKNQSSYAPKLMLRMECVKGISQTRLEHAQERLLDKEVIRNEKSIDEQKDRKSASLKIINEDEANTVIKTWLLFGG